MKSSVIIFPGSNCDRDMDVALKKFGFKNQMVWHNDLNLPKSDLIILPGGFSYGDYLRCGSIAAKSKIIKSVVDFANSGGLVVGVCNGFQILIETGLLPGALLKNKYLEFICKNVFVKINNSENKYFKNTGEKTMDIAITPNRPDCLGIRGIARDLASSGLGHLKKQPPIKINQKFKSPIKVSLKKLKLNMIEKNLMGLLEKL